MTDERLQDARAWAKAWKRAAKWHRNTALYYRDMWDNRAPYAAELKALTQCQAAEIERLRGVLRALYGTYGVTKAWQRKWPNINTTVLNTLKETDHDAR